MSSHFDGHFSFATKSSSSSSVSLIYAGTTTNVMNMLTLQVLFEIAQLLSNFDVGRDSVFTLLEKD